MSFKCLFSLQISDILVMLPQKQIEHRHGSILAISHAIHRKIKLMRQGGQFNESSVANWPVLKNALSTLIAHLDDQQPLLVSAAIKGISLIGSATPLPLPPSATSASTESTTFDPDEAMDVDNEPENYTKSYVAKSILKLLKSAHSRQKIREESAVCLGYLAIGDGAYFTKGNLNAFIKLTKLVSAEIVRGLRTHLIQNSFSDTGCVTQHRHCPDYCVHCIGSRESRQ